MIISEVMKMFISFGDIIFNVQHIKAVDLFKEKISVFTVGEDERHNKFYFRFKSVEEARKQYERLHAYLLHNKDLIKLG